MRLQVILLMLVASACQSAHDASCGGARVNLCAPYEHTQAHGATLTPDRLTVADFALAAHVHVEADVCAMAPDVLNVELEAIIPGPDGGSAVQVTSLLTLRDGQPTDPTPRDGIIDVDVTNPFVATVPTESEIRLRFVPRIGAAGCVGDAVEIPYHTGPARAP